MTATQPEGLDMTTLTDEQIDALAQPYLTIGDGDTEHDSIDWRGFARALLSASKPAAMLDAGLRNRVLRALMTAHPKLAAEYESATAAPAQSGDDVRERIARALHYPPCWDTAAYPTLESAMLESLGDFMCTTCLDKIAAPQPSPTAVVLDERAALTNYQIREIALKYCAHEMPERFYNILRYDCEEDFFNLVRDLLNRAASPQPAEQTGEKS